MATFFANQAKDQLIDYAKSQLFEQLKEKLNQGDAGIDALFADLKNKLASFTVLNQNVLQTILAPICVSKQEDLVKTELKERIDKIDFSKELEKMKEQMPGITDELKLKIDALPETLKNKLKTLIDEVITCNAASAPAPTAVSAGGSKKKRRQKTKKNSYKKSRGRKRHSRK